VQLLHRFIRHVAFTYGGTSGRRVIEIINARYGHLKIYEELGLPEGRAPKISVGFAKNNKLNLREPVLQPLYPTYSNMVIDPGLVSWEFA
jgi:hypothetical protein